MCVFGYAWSLPVTWQRWRSHHWIRHSRISLCYTQTLRQCFIEPELLLIKVLHCENTDFLSFCSCDLDLDSIIFIYELDSYSLEIYWMCKNKLPMLRLSKVIVGQTYIQTDRWRWNYVPCCFDSSFCFQVTTVIKLLTHRCLCDQAV